jgi:aldose 1-epimerase
MPLLSRNGLVLELAPEVGGAVRRFTWQGLDLLRPMPEGSRDPLQAACFPLLPFANRIAQGAFSFEGRQVRLGPTLAGDPHALHGQGWLASWRVEAAETQQAVMAYEHAAGESGWPWPYAARQSFVLADNGLHIELEVTNTGAEAMPVGLGFHPYITAPAGACATTEVGGVWLTDTTLLPTELAGGDTLADWEVGVFFPRHKLIDHCHSDWGGALTLTAPNRPTLTLDASSDLRWLHIYAPAGAGFFCAEPVSHMPDAVNRTEPAFLTGLERLEPGRRRSAWISLAVDPPR